MDLHCDLIRVGRDLDGVQSHVLCIADEASKEDLGVELREETSVSL